MKELTLYKPKKSIFNIFHKKNITIFGTMHIINERKYLLKQYKSFSKNKIDAKTFERYFEDYIDVLNDFMMNKVYKRVKNGIASESESKLLSNYYPILQLKTIEYYEYVCKKQLFLLLIDYNNLNISQNLQVSYKEMYDYETNELFTSLIKNFSDSYNSTEDDKEKYVIKIVNTLKDYSEQLQITLEDSKNKFSEYFSESILNLIDKKLNIQNKETVSEESSSKLPIDENNFEEIITEFSTDSSLEDIIEGISSTTEEDIPKLSIDEEKTDEIVLEAPIDEEKTDENVLEAPIYEEKTDENVSEAPIDEEKADENVSDTPIDEEKVDENVSTDLDDVPKFEDIIQDLSNLEANEITENQNKSED